MNQKTVFAIIAIVAAVGLAAATVATTNMAYAKIQCVNPGGGNPQGQCNGQALAKENPAGHQPPGQNQ
jgi:hypothetical protein